MSDQSDGVAVEREKSASALALEHAQGQTAAAAASVKNAHEVDLERVKSAAALALEHAEARTADAAARAAAVETTDLEETKATIAIEAADLQAERESRRAYHDKVVEVAAGSIERSRDAAKFVQNAAGALITAYAALLALVFSVDGTALPLRGIYAATFLGVAIAGAIGYLAFLTRPQPADAYVPGDSLATTELNRTRSFIVWVNAAVSNRQALIRVAVVAFFVGVAFIPAAFIGPTTPTTTATAPSPPTPPSEVPDALSDDAARLFEFQVDEYLAATGADPAAPATPPDECDGPTSPFRACGWVTETAVETSFRWLAGFGVIVVLLPLMWWGVVAVWGLGRPGRSVLAFLAVVAVGAAGFALGTAV